MTSLSSMKAFKMSPSGNTTVSMSGFYMAGCLDFDAEYNEKNGSMSIASGTPIFDMESYMVYLCPWDSENEEVITRPIEYRYAGNNTWQNDNDLMLVAILDENIQTSSFSNSSTMCAATVLQPTHHTSELPEVRTNTTSRDRAM